MGNDTQCYYPISEVLGLYIYFRSRVLELTARRYILGMFLADPLVLAYVQELSLNPKTILIIVKSSSLNLDTISTSISIEKPIRSKHHPETNAQKAPLYI